MERIAHALGIPNFTTYTARHSFATILDHSGASTSYIKGCLGHSSIKTTEGYLASFATEAREKNARLLTAFQ